MNDQLKEIMTPPLVATLARFESGKPTEDDLGKINNTPISVTLLDTLTGETEQTARYFSGFWWSEGNGSCDCNRNFNELDDAPEVNYCIGSHRYLIVAVQHYFGDKTIWDFNESYPKELLNKHLPSWTEKTD